MAKKSSKNSNKKYYKKVKTAVVVNEGKNNTNKKKSLGVKNNINPNNKFNKNNKGVRKAVVVNQQKKAKPKKYIPKDVREKVQLSKKKTTLKKKEVKQVVPVIEEAKLEEFVPIPAPEDTIIMRAVNEEAAREEEVREEFENKIDRIIEFEVDGDKDTSLDDIDVLKFPSKKEKTTIKKKPKASKTKRFNMEDISSSIDTIEKTDEEKIEKEFEEDLLFDKNKDEIPSFKRKKKGKNYVINIHKTKTYKELEDNLRQLYDKVNDVVEDFDTTTELEPIVEEDNLDKPIKPSFLDKISQKVLNVFLIILFIIFFLMCIAFVVFVIYVSTV